MANQFRAPTSEMPEWLSLFDDNKLLFVVSGYEGATLDASEAEALLRVLLEVCPNAAHIVAQWIQPKRFDESLIETGRAP